MAAMKIVYDGDCPFCSAYVTMVRLRDAVGEVELLDARSGDPRVAALVDRGFDLDDGMALVQGEQVWFGSDCMNRLALLSTPSGLFNRINARIFASRRVSAALYPVLRFGRNVTLFLLGRRRIGA